jgi:hypothetical protein
MSYQDPPRRQRPSRYPAFAQYEDSYSSYPDYQSNADTHAGYRRGNGYADDYRGFAGLAGSPRQRAPWDDPWDQPTEWEVPRRTSGPFLAADGEYAVRRDDDYGIASDDGHRRPRRAGDRGLRPSRGLLAGGVAGFLAAAVALGVANLVAAFVRPQASPIIAVGGAFIDRTPPALKNFAVEKFGENDKNMLLLGMYVTIALIAIAIGVLAWRRVAIGVAGIGLFGLFGAFVAITRPESHVTDVIPSVIGGIAGIAVMVWLVRVGMPGGRRYRGAWAEGNS